MPCISIYLLSPSLSLFPSPSLMIVFKRRVFLFLILSLILSILSSFWRQQRIFMTILPSVRLSIHFLNCSFYHLLPLFLFIFLLLVLFLYSYAIFSILPQNHHHHHHHLLYSASLWFKIAKTQDVSTGPIAHLFICLLALLTHLLAPHFLLRSRVSLCSFVHLFDQSLTSW